MSEFSISLNCVFKINILCYNKSEEHVRILIVGNNIRKRKVD